MSTETEAVILSAARTPIGKFQGVLSGLPATKLGAIVVKAAVQRAGLDANDIEEVLMGNVIQAGLGQAPARQAALNAGLPATVGATTINKVCGSGLKAAMSAAQAIRAGDAEVFVAGGMESMSRAPYLVNGRGGELKFGNQALTDALLNDGLWDAFENWSMGEAAEFIADEYEVTRQAMDEFALASHQRQSTPWNWASSRMKSSPWRWQTSMTKGSRSIVTRGHAGTHPLSRWQNSSPPSKSTAR